ncbi:ABC transporter ATP-binding protein [Klugiella xanthotipulae]|uniref:Putative ABC transport system ATP-binding protein n=1 Tax=Klugiella xanthotipulae TaxID=244735 RepID=A0A543I5S9_9MICO|nr:ATP-binding cassette domain-containing protein [Klugiella xanthotipulae]TQM65924.1 putative ABC transport system ATP-binding protein [Klugiella xanthotipulae]
MIRLEDVDKVVVEPNGLRRDLFRSLNFSLSPAHSSVAILGRSGSGKSTLLKILAGLDTRYQGKYFFEGEPLLKNGATMARYRRENIGIVTQSYHLLSDRNVVQNVLLGFSGKKSIARAKECLALVQLEKFEKKSITQLSGGEAQRVAIARALVKNPRVILADEPTGALDEETENHILSVFSRLESEGHTLIVTTHNERVAGWCQSRLMLSDKKLVPQE